eukprot:m.190935 g.190935  ORF g.190935 m.190935 type:complete len:777 (+) comp18178_c0_seq1:135-2465(+)
MSYEAQRTVLKALIETLVPATQSPRNDGTGQHADRTARFLATAPCVDLVADACLKCLQGLPDDERVEAMSLLWLLSTRLGTSLVCLSNPLGLPFPERPIHEREALLSGLASSQFALRRKAFGSLRQLIAIKAFSVMDSNGKNPFWEVGGYKPILDEYGPVDPDVDASTTTQANKAYHNLKQHRVDVQQDTEINVDCVVVGSGAGGGVAAAMLSEAGLSVIVLEKGPLVDLADMTTREQPAYESMYEKGGLLTTSDGAMGILAGSTMGGGTTINWACCIPLPQYVRKEWSDGDGLHKLAQFAPSTTDTEGGPSEYDRAITSVLTRIGASTDGVQHNASNQVLLDGAAKMGYPATTTAQNFNCPAADSAGWTCLGDRYGNKQGTLVTFLADAAATGNCQFVDRCAVERVTFGTDATTGRKRGNGVIARVNGKDGPVLTVNARRCVVVSAGSLHTPGVLLRSGLTNPHIGKHLRLHPVTGVLGRFRDREMRAWRGAPMTTVCGAAEAGPRNDMYGAKIEVPSVHPALGASGMPWHSGLAYKQSLSEFASISTLITLCRDKGEGEVALGGASGFDPPKVHYTLSPADSESMVWAMAHCVRIFAAAGADKVFTTHAGPVGRVEAEMTGEDVGNPDSSAVNALIDRIVAAGTAPGTLGLFSAHQMGSCRMGMSPATSVVDWNGEVWEADDVYIMDASVFPTASGANPMITTLSISQMLSWRLVARLQGEADDELYAHRRTVPQTHQSSLRQHLPRLALAVVCVVAVVGVYRSHVAVSPTATS